MSYEGWENRETWMVNLHLSNDQGTYLYVCDMSDSAIEQANDDPGYYASPKEAYVSTLARMLEEYVEEMVIDPIADAEHLLTTDLLRSALASVNWGEIAEKWDEEADGKLREEEEAE